MTRFRSLTTATFVAAMSVLLALTACSPADPAPSETTPATTSASSSPTAVSSGNEKTSGLMPEAEGKTVYPLELESPWGTTTLTERPVRIAAVTPSQDDVEALVALGVTPVLADEKVKHTWIERELRSEIPARFSSADTKFPIEQIAAADPDLIVVLGADVSAEYGRLSDIAPVLSTSQAKGGEKSVANDWKTSLQAIGEALDLQGAAQKVLADQEEFFTKFRAEHPQFAGRTVSYVIYYGSGDGGLQYHSAAGGPVGYTFEQMGFAPNPNAAGLGYRAKISNELLSTIDADAIIFSDNSKGAFAEVTDSPLFQNLTAVKDNRLVMIDNRAAENKFVIGGTEHEGNLSWALARSGPLSSTWAAEQLAPVMSEILGK